MVALLIGFSKGGLGGSMGALATPLMALVVPAGDRVDAPDFFDVQRMYSVIWILSLLPLGVWRGKWLADKISREVFERVIVALLVVTAGWLIFS